MLALALFATGCGPVAKLFGKEDSPPVPAVATGPEPVQETASDGTKVLVANAESNFQWALQAFEAGHYQDALERFDDIAEDGHTSELIPYYQGRALYYLGRHKEAVERLTLFVTRNPKSLQAREARLTILVAQNTLRDWERSTVLAAEALQDEAYIGNKILIRLLWGEALIERGELTGARKVIHETKSMFASIPEGSLLGDVMAESKSSLAERELWLESHLHIRGCAADRPPAQAKVKQLTDWYRRRGACLKQAFDIALVSFTILGPRWNRAMSNTLTFGIENFLDSPEAAIAAQALKHPNAAREVGLPEIRKYFYQILDRLEHADRSSSVPSTVPRPFRALITKIEQGLQSLSLKAASSDRAL